MVSSRISLHTLFLITATFAGGFGVARLTDDVAYGFCLGVLTVFISVGLVQQVIGPAAPDSGRNLRVTPRRIAIVLILVCLCIAIYRTGCPYLVPNPNLIGEPQETVVESAVAMPLWVFTLVLGALTARGATQSTSRRSAQGSILQRTSSVLVTVSVITYIGYVVTEWTNIPVLVDIAVQGILQCMHQGLAVGTPHFVPWFGRTPDQLHQFVANQVWSWPLLIVALFASVSASQIRVRSKRKLVLCVGAALLTVPAILNALWLTGGGARQAFPIFLDTFWSEPRPDLAMLLPPLLLITLYLTTRRGYQNDDEVAIDQRILWCDRTIVGWLFIAVGILGYARAVYDFYEFYFAYYVPNGSLANLTFFELVVLGGQFVSDIFAYPQILYPAFLIPFGIGWLRRRRRLRSEPACGERWPQIGTHQLLWLPVVLLLLTASILLCIPFGIAAFHVGI